MRLALAIVALCGCDSVFGIDHIELPDAATCADRTSNDDDGDGIPDGCDNCPGTTNANQLDTTEVTNGDVVDGVGDACDPTPARSGDRLDRFLSFDDAQDAKLFTIHDGPWASEDGAYGYDSLVGSNFDQTALNGAPPSQYGVQLGVEVVTLGDPANAEISLLADFDLSNGARHQCSLDLVNGFIASPGGGAMPTTLLGTGARFRAAMTLRDGVTRCEFDDLVRTSNQEGLSFPVKFALEARSIQLRVSYVAVYEIPITAETAATPSR